MIQMVWRQYAQAESQKKGFALAEEMLKRVGELLSALIKYEKTLISYKKISSTPIKSLYR